VTDAKRTPLGRKEALAAARSAREVFVAKGKTVTRVDLAKDRPDDDALAALLLGPTGNLRAPTVRLGRTLLVGFHPEMYGRFFV
jgi:arsenate reductase-like glutaredoxin family protein